MRCGIVAKAIPLISSVALRGKPKGSHVLTVGSLVPAGLNFPIGLFCSSNSFPSAVSDGGSPLSPSGTPPPARGPPHDPLRSCWGAAPPASTALSAGSYFQLRAACPIATDEKTRTAADAMTAPVNTFRILFSSSVELEAIGVRRPNGLPCRHRPGYPEAGYRLQIESC